MVVVEKRSGTLGSRLSAVAVRGEAALGLQAHLTAPYWPCWSLDQQTVGQYLSRLSTPVAECACSAAEPPLGTKLRAY